MTYSFLVFLATLMFVFIEIYFTYHVRKQMGFRNLKDWKIAYAAATTPVIILLVLVYRGYRALLGFFLYSGILFAIFDILRLIVKRVIKSQKKKDTLYKIHMGGIWIFIVSIVISIIGYVNAHNYKIVEYDLNTDKAVEDLKIGFASDFHLGTSIDLDDLKDICSMMNDEKYDIILLGGDVFDENTGDTLREQAFEVFGTLKAKYGTYFIFGNHDLGYHEDRNIKKQDIIDSFAKVGIPTVDDEYILINDEFYLVGYADPGTNSRNGEKSKSPKKLYKGIDTDKYIITVNHRPVDIAENAQLGCDLFLAGHTHNGQFWPFNFAIQWFTYNDIAYGYKNIDGTDAIVSCGIGTWQIPIKTAGPSEVETIYVSTK